MHMPIVRLFEETNYEMELSVLIGLLHKRYSATTDRPLSPRRTCESFSEKRFSSNQEYWATDIDVEIRLRRYAVQHRKCLVARPNVELFDILPQGRVEFFSYPVVVGL